MRVTVIGTGYVGTVTGACLAYLGHRVTCVDTDDSQDRKAPGRRLAHLRAAPGRDAEAGRGARRHRFQHRSGARRRASDVIFIAVGTPPLPSGEANLSYLEAAARGIGAAMDRRRFRVVVNKSTVPVGCGNLVETLVREGIAEAGRQRQRGCVRRGQQSGVPARRLRHRRFALSRPHRGGRVRRPHPGAHARSSTSRWWSRTSIRRRGVPRPGRFRRPCRW